MKQPVRLTRRMMVAVGVAVLGLSDDAFAHHSAAMYDASKVVTLHGTLQKTQLSNPHSWFWLVVPNSKGSEDVWALESHGVGEFLKRYGPEAKSELAVGQKVSVTIHPLRDGRMSGQLIKIILANGKELN